MERAQSLLNKKGRVIGRQLLQWYGENERDLPFRRSRDPYRIWISEVMLQQTRVKAMLPSYDSFIRRFPDLKTLAQAAIHDVLDAWKGLGYYRRARNLHAAANQMLKAGLNSPPTDYQALLAFQGIGPYTAAAVASISADEPFAVLDGNVKRVISRLTGTVLPDRQLQSLASLLLVTSEQPSSRFNQAIMELGALICTPGKPVCYACPIKKSCVAFATGGSDYAATIPRAKAKVIRNLQVDILVHSRHCGESKEYALIDNSDGMFLKEGLFFPHQIFEDGSLLYSTEGSETNVQRPTGSLRHSIMNWRISADIYVHRYRLRNSQTRWVQESELKSLLHSSFALKVVSFLEKPVDGGHNDTPANQSRSIDKARDLKTQ